MNTIVVTYEDLFRNYEQYVIAKWIGCKIPDGSWAASQEAYEECRSSEMIHE
jgi:hypothetical protein